MEKAAARMIMSGYMNWITKDQMVAVDVSMVVRRTFSESLWIPYARVMGQKMAKITIQTMTPRIANIGSLMYRDLYSTEILAQICKNISGKWIVSTKKGCGDTIAFQEKYYGILDSMSSYVNLFTIVNLIYYTRVRVRIGWQNI